MSKRYGTLADRFHTQYIPEPNSGCWLWTGAYKQKNLPYGQLRLPNSKREAYAHRVSFELHYGVTLGRSDFVCHRCDNPPCVNSEHLFLGDKYSNMADRDQKHRQKRGSSHSRAKLTEAQVVEIRADKGFGAAIARKYGVSFSTIALIRAGKTWKHVKTA